MYIVDFTNLNGFDIDMMISATQSRGSVKMHIWRKLVYLRRIVQKIKIWLRE
jgi:hypothetical protein